MVLATGAVNRATGRVCVSLMSRELNAVYAIAESRGDFSLDGHPNPLPQTMRDVIAAGAIALQGQRLEAHSRDRELCDRMTRLETQLETISKMLLEALYETEPPKK